MLHLRVAVAVSGGRDSTALLHCTARAAAKLSRLGDVHLQVFALHVHHGLQEEADSWATFVKGQVKRWARGGLPVAFDQVRLAVSPSRGESVEAWARRERYAALANMARALDCNTVLLAHHRRDQAETVLLQALRGAGAAGLSAMPRAAWRDGIHWLRPWLDQPRERVEGYLRRWQLRFVDDPSNGDHRFGRNRVRASVWPQFCQAFPDAEVSLAAVARRAQEANACLHELAQLDMALCVDGAALLRPAWLALSEARRANVLRAWLRGALRGAQMRVAPESLVWRLLAELPTATNARWPNQPMELRLYRDRLTMEKIKTRATTSSPPACTLNLSKPGRVPLAPWHGHFVIEATDGAGLDAAALSDTSCRPRSGSEQFQASAGSIPRSLKKQYQARGVATADRSGPLVYLGDDLVYVPGLGADARWLCHDAELRVNLRWQPDDGSAPSASIKDQPA